MKFISQLLLLLLLSLFIIGCGEKKIIEEIKETYPDGKPKLKLFFVEVNGRKEIIKDQYFYDNGQLFGEVQYKGGTKNGNFTQYLQNGLKESEGIYKNGKRYEWTTFEYNDINQKIAEENFDEDGDRLSRTSFLHFENGNLKSEEFYIDGQKVIYWTYFKENGKMESSGYTKRGKKDGDWKYYLADKSYKRGSFNNGNRLGKWKYFDEVDNEYNNIEYFKNNVIMSLGVIQNNKNNGKWTTYFSSGQVQSKGEYLDGKENGIWKYYLMDDSYKSANYKNGNIVSDWNYFDENGAKYTEVEFHPNKIIKTLGMKKGKNNEGRWTHYYQNGGIQSIGYFKVGNRDGKWTWYHENKKLESMGFYKDGYKSGRWVLYYNNGQLKNVGEFKDRKRIGKWLSYYKNGQIESEGKYINRMKEGEWIQYYESGKVKRIGKFEAGELIESQNF